MKLMMQDEWLVEIDSAEKTEQWEKLKSLAERRLTVAPDDLDAVIALKTANRALESAWPLEFDEHTFTAPEVLKAHHQMLGTTIHHPVITLPYVLLYTLMAILTLFGTSYFVIFLLFFPISHGAFGNISVGYGLDYKSCRVVESAVQWHRLANYKTETISIVSPYERGEAGDTVEWLLKGPDGSIARRGYRILSHDYDLCMVDNIVLTYGDQSGCYQLEVFHEQEIVFTESFVLMER